MSKNLIFLLVLVGVFLIANLATFLLMYHDKKRAVFNASCVGESGTNLRAFAQKNYKRGRISELTFVVLSFLGGFIGCTIGKKVFSHKTRSKMFSIGVPIIGLIGLMHYIMAFLLFVGALKITVELTKIIL